jgi:Zn-dependent protease with chaperone function
MEDRLTSSSTSSDAAAPETECPRCAAQLPVVAGYAPWCHECDWNLHPRPPVLPAGRLARWRQRRSHRAVEAVYQRACHQGPTVSRRLAVAGALSAVPVHLVTLVLVAGAAALAVGDLMPAVRVVGLALLAGVLWQVGPWPGRAPSGPGVLTATEAPATFAVIAEVADRIGARSPHLLVVQQAYNAAYGVAGWRGRRVMMLGLPLWNVLGDQEKLALLGHELGHDVNRDVRASLPMRTAAAAMRGWARLLHPASLGWHSTPYGVARVTSVGGLVRLAEMMAVGILHVLHAVVRLAGSVVEQVALRMGQPAEYRADLIAADVAGREAAIGLVTKLLLADQARFALVAATNRGERDLWSAQRRHLTGLPAREVLRAERRSRQTFQSIDSSHPPTHHRLDFLRARPDTPPSVHLAPDALRAVDAELFAAARREPRSAPGMA